MHAEILLPSHAPPEFKDRATLWNAVEQAEKNKNAQLAREIELALPVELSEIESRSLVRAYCQKYFVDKGMCADIGIHDTGTGNPHAHSMLTMRPLEQDGTWAAKSKKEYLLDENGEKILLKSGEYKSRKVNAVDWNEQSKAEEWRQGWAEIANLYLQKTGKAERIDHRSYERQGVELIPTIHLGATATALERKGIATNRGNINREIAVSNQKLRQLKARISKLQDWVKTESQNPTPPTLASLITSVLEHREQTGERSRYGTISSLKAAAELLNFLTTNKIDDMDSLSNKLKSMLDTQFDIRDKLKKVERRMAILEKHIHHCRNYKGYRANKAQYEKLYAQYENIEVTGGFGAKRKAEKALDAAQEYRETYRLEIGVFNEAEEYLREVMQTHFTPNKLPPITKWEAELKQLTADRKKLDLQYGQLRNETATAEKIKRSIEDILSEKGKVQERKREVEVEMLYL